jgi:phage-related protein
VTLEHPAAFTARNIFTAQPAPYLWLFELTSPAGGPIIDVGGDQTVLRVTPNPEPIQFDGLTWAPYPVTFGNLSRDSSGRVSAINVAFSNAAPGVAKLMNLNDQFRDHRLRLILVHGDFLLSPSHKVVIKTTVTSIQSDWQASTLALSAYDQTSFHVPTQLIMDRCRWTYRGYGCDFVGDTDNLELGSCAKTLTACRLRGQWEIDNALATSFLDAEHPRRFGAFPGLLVGAYAPNA